MTQHYVLMEKHALKNCIYSYLETSGGQSSNSCLNVVHFFKTRVNYKSVAAYAICFLALVSNMRCSIATLNNYHEPR
jgi:hypothetical protein